MPPPPPVTPGGANEFLVLCVYAAAVGLASALGGALPGRVRLTHLRLQLAMSCVGGLMLGVALFGLIPHAAAAFGRVEPALWGVALGLLGMFFLIRFAPFHSHEPPSAVEHEGGEGGCGHPHHDPHPSAAGWAGAAFGLGVHALIDGAALAAAVRGGHAGGPGLLGLGALPGFGAFLAVALHKPLDAVTVMTLARAAPRGSWSRRRPRAVNLAFAAVGPAGAVGFYLLAGAAPAENLVTGAAMAVAAGAFLCIALSDLLPELEFHAHDRFKLSAALLLGVGVAAAVEVLAHGHGHAAGDEAGPAHVHPHGHPHSH